MKNSAIRKLGALMLILALMLSIIPGVNAESYTFSNNCINLVAKFEGCRLQAYKSTSGVWTIGYGHVNGVEPGMTLASEAEAMKILKEDLTKAASSVRRLMDKGTIGFEMNQNRFDALVSFTFSCGAGNLESLVKGHTAEQVADKIPGYSKAGGKVLPSLARRRSEERDLFVK